MHEKDLKMGILDPLFLQLLYIFEVFHNKNVFKRERERECEGSEAYQVCL